MSPTALSATGIVAGYGRAAVLHGVSLSAEPGEVVGILGPNGAGKSTLLKAMAGLVTPRAGSVHLLGHDVSDHDTWRRSRAGLGFVIEGGKVFESMTVDENLELAAIANGKLPADWSATVDECYGWFPVLREKRSLSAGGLSGGQRQMLAIARGFAARSEVLLLDEPAVGLSVRIARELADMIRELAQRGVAIIVADQNPDFLERATHTCHVVDQGRITWTGPGAHLRTVQEARDAAIGSGIG